MRSKCARQGALLLMLGTLVPSCDRPNRAATPGKPPAALPAVVEHRVTEDQLTAVALTEAAEQRLGIRVAPLEVKASARRRQTGGEVVSSSGGATRHAAPISGTVSLSAGANRLTVGSRVAAGDIVCLLTPLLGIDAETSLSAARAAADGALKKAAIEVDAAKLALTRAQQLLADNAGTQRSVDEAASRLQGAEAARKGHEAERDILAHGLTPDPDGGSRFPIRAPVSGFLRNVHVAPAQVVATGALLFEIVSTEGLWIRATIYAGDLLKIDATAPAEVARLGSAATIPAVPADGPPIADPASFSVDLYYDAPTTEIAWRVGERVNVSLPLLGVADGIVVPPGAIVHDAHGGSWVYESLGSHRYARRRVSVEAGSGEQVVLRSTLTPGTAVVVDGAAELFGTEFGPGK